MFFKAEEKENYVVIGSVVFHVSGDGKIPLQPIKKEAAKIGVDAIIRFNQHKFNSFRLITEASGMAIKK